MFKRKQKAVAERREAEQANVFEKVKEIIAELINAQPGYITENTSLKKELQLDDISFFEIAMQLEEEFAIEISNDCQNWTTVKDILDTLREKGIE